MSRELIKRVLRRAPGVVNIQEDKPRKMTRRLMTTSRGGVDFGSRDERLRVARSKPVAKETR